MDQKEKDAATIAMLMKRFNESRLPRATRMLERVRKGEKISGHDLFWLKKVHEDSRSTRDLLKRNPEYSDLVSRFIDMYTEITSKALENEKSASGHE